MYRISQILALVVALLLIGCASQQPGPKENGKVLIILREKKGVSRPQGISDEAPTMKNMLKEAGFKVEMASVSGQKYRYFDSKGNVALESTSKLSDVKTYNYVGFVFPCMQLGNIIVLPEEVAFAKQVAAEGRLIAAQHKGVLILAEAGVLAGRRYAYRGEITWIERLAGAIYDGSGVVQDRNIITSGLCPYYNPSQTTELIQAFIAELQK